MTLATLAIHTEAWLQEELGAQRAVLAALEQLDAAARAGSSSEVEGGARALAGLLALAGARDARRRALLGRLSGELGLPAQQLTLSKLTEQLDIAQLETRRITSLRADLREVVASVLRVARRLAAVAKYHRGLLEDLCQLFLAEAPAGERHLIDARA